jgi:DNA-binding NarL/FixJ family response regulator
MMVSAVSSAHWWSVLSPREREIALLVSRGFADKKIALELELSPGTVKQHVHHIFMKLGIRTRKTLLGAAPHLRLRNIVRRSTWAPVSKQWSAKQPEPSG